MRGKKVKAYHQCSKETALEMFSCKNKEQKSTRLGEQGLIYKISFFIFTSLFAILLAFQQAYTEFTEQLDTSGTPRQFQQERAGQKNKTDIQPVDAQSSLDQENVTPHQSAEQETASRLLSQEPVQRQLQQKQQSQQGQNQNILLRETKPATGQNGQTC